VRHRSRWEENIEMDLNETECLRMLAAFIGSCELSGFLKGVKILEKLHDCQRLKDSALWNYHYYYDYYYSALLLSSSLSRVPWKVFCLTFY
jgi:hypothetical protein